MNRRLQRRMALSRQMLRSRVRVTPPADAATAADGMRTRIAAGTRPLTDAETQDLVEHDCQQFLNRSRDSH